MTLLLGAIWSTGWLGLLSTGRANPSVDGPAQQLLMYLGKNPGVIKSLQKMYETLPTMAKIRDISEQEDIEQLISILGEEKLQDIKDAISERNKELKRERKKVDAIKLVSYPLAELYSEDAQRISLSRNTEALRNWELLHREARTRIGELARCAEETRPKEKFAADYARLLQEIAEGPLGQLSVLATYSTATQAQLFGMGEQSMKVASEFGTLVYRCSNLAKKYQEKLEIITINIDMLRQITNVSVEDSAPVGSDDEASNQRKKRDDIDAFAKELEGFEDQADAKSERTESRKSRGPALTDLLSDAQRNHKAEMRALEQDSARRQTDSALGALEEGFDSLVDSYEKDNVNRHTSGQGCSATMAAPAPPHCCRLVQQQINEYRRSYNATSDPKYRELMTVGIRENENWYRSHCR